MLIQNLSVDHTGDLIIENNDLVLVYGKDVFVQALSQILKTRKGEYILDLEEGLVFETLFKKDADLDNIQAAIIDAAQQVQVFSNFTLFNFDYNIYTRVLSIHFSAKFIDTEETFEEEVRLYV